MTQEQWTGLDAYFEQHLLQDDPVLNHALAESDAAGLPQHNVSATQGKMLMLFAQMQQVRTILEIGTLGAYSTIWMARALPKDGKIITLEYDPDNAEVARKNLAYAGVTDQVDVITGAALETLPTLENSEYAPFDLIFIDANKDDNLDYLRWSLKLSRPGTIIIADNVVRGGEVLQADSEDGRVQGIRGFHRTGRANRECYCNGHSDCWK